MKNIYALLGLLFSSQAIAGDLEYQRCNHSSYFTSTPLRTHFEGLEFPGINIYGKKFCTILENSFGYLGTVFQESDFEREINFESSFRISDHFNTNFFFDYKNPSRTFDIGFLLNTELTKRLDLNLAIMKPLTTNEESLLLGLELKF